MSAVLAALAGVAANGAISSIQQKRANEASRANVRLQNRLENENIFKAPGLMAKGYQAAGLNPAGISGTSFSAPAVSAPQGAQGFPVDAATPLLSALQAENVLKLQEAQIGNIEAQTEHQELLNTRIRDEDYTLDSNIRGLLETWSNDSSNPARQTAAELMLVSQDIFTRGTADGIQLWANILSTNDQNLTNEVVNEFTRLLYAEKKNNGDLHALANMDKAELKKTLNEAILLMSEAGKASTEADVNKARLGEISAHIADLIEDKDFKYASNLVKQYKNNDKKAVFINLLSKAVNAAAAGAGFYAGAKGAGFAGRKASGALSKTSKRYSDTIDKLAPFPKGTIQSPSFEMLNRSEKNKKLMSYY